MVQHICIKPQCYIQLTANKQKNYYSKIENAALTKLLLKGYCLFQANLLRVPNSHYKTDCLTFLT